MHIAFIPLIVRKLLPKGIIWSIKSEKTLYLTFDDGPVPEVTPKVLQILKEYNAKATFFCVGNNVTKYPELFQQILDEGHLTGNHTFSHLNGFRSENKKYFADIEKCNGYIDSIYFRPPHGRMTPAQYKLLIKKYRIVMWTVLTGDYNKSLSNETVLRNALRYSKDGSIIVFHDSIKASERMLYALPAFLKHFSQRGYKFEVIS